MRDNFRKPSVNNAPPSRQYQSNPPNAPALRYGRAPLEPVSKLVDRLKGAVDSLEARFAAPLEGNDVVAYTTVKEYAPDLRSSFQLDTAQTGVGTNPVNYVLRDAQDYPITMNLPGPGAFRPRSISIRVFQRRFDPNIGIMWQPLQTALYYGGNFTTKFQLGWSAVTNNRFAYMWKMQMDASGIMLSDDYMSSTVLLPQSPSFTPSGGLDSNIIPDGDIFDLSRFTETAPMERDSQMTFIMRPLIPILQFDSSLNGTNAAIGLPFDDRENGVRNNAVRVHFTLHGVRVLTTQDGMRQGARR